MNRLLMTPSPDELFSHPFRWAGKHLAFYAAASLVAGSLFVAGAAVYSRVVPAAPKPAPDIITEPTKLKESPPPQQPPSGADLVAMAPGSVPISVSKTIGAN